MTFASHSPSYTKLTPYVARKYTKFFVENYLLRCSVGDLQASDSPSTNEVVNIFPYIEHDIMLDAFADGTYMGLKRNSQNRAPAALTNVLDSTLTASGTKHKQGLVLLRHLTK